MCPGHFYPLYTGFIRKLSRPWARSLGINKTSITCSFGCDGTNTERLFAPCKLTGIPTTLYLASPLYPLYTGFIRKLSRPWTRSLDIHKTSISCSFGCVGTNTERLFAPRKLTGIPTTLYLASPLYPLHTGFIRKTE